MEILNVENLIFKYPKQNDPVLNDVSFSIEEGEFAVLCGATGSGKSTLLKLLKPEITPFGERRGRIALLGKEQDPDAEKKTVSPSRIGYVCQNPKEQVVTDKVWHELAFGLENMNMSQNEMSAKVAEMAAYFGIEDWFEKKVNELSGGQLQLLNLASVMVMDPEILILDEPTAQLDPVAASEFITTVRKLNSDFAITVLIAEHRLEELIPVCDRVLVMKNGKLVLNGKPEGVLGSIKQDDEIFDAFPSAYRLYKKIRDKNDTIGNASGKDKGRIPLNIREGREFVKLCVNGSSCGDGGLSNGLSAGKNDGTHKDTTSGDPALEFKDVSFRYSREAEDALKDLSFTVNTGEIFCILGGNGSGKTTALNVAAGLLKPYEGNVKIFGKKIKEYKNQSLYNKCLSMLPQDVQTVFLHNTVREELESRKALDKLSDFPFDLSGMMDKHPYDLSGGEQQLVTLAIVLATEPKILLLDEPTKGLDAYRKKNLTGILKKLKADGITIVVVTHDVEFAAGCADRCALFFRGNMASIGNVRDFFYGNIFYTTCACRLSRGICEGEVTVDGLAGVLSDNNNKDISD
ncbi:MAG: ATP-binding cassette domain-containing protein [Lachnospiraceae bacterium]|nr:ATP-binding cassette domain-containing protein [Lachnospiraceae bacterium]